jgi:rhodanese-related sulfurtransferase|tara:strand:- start:270 stop:701 length:432 start_codon:yes stop_codon:yes gene_type:complete
MEEKIENKLNPTIMKKLSKFLGDTGDDWNYIIPTQLKSDLISGKDCFLLDTRKPEDYAKGHIEGAVNIFWLDLLKNGNLKKLPKNKRINVCCYVGHTASQVLVILSLLGFDAKVLKFGMGQSPAIGVPVAGWENYGFDTVKGD